MEGKFSADPKVYLVSLDEIFTEKNCLKERDYDYSGFVVFTQSLVVLCRLKLVSLNFGERLEERYDYFIVAYRNGIDEYNYVNEKLDKAEAKLKEKDTPAHKKKVKYYKDILKRIPPFKPFVKNDPSDCFESSLIETEYKSTWKDAGKYVVLDVETNGLSPKTHDLLSISIFDPVTGVCYNRFLPLENQPIVETTHINGIATSDTYDKTPLNQEEVNKIINYFDLNNKTILQYSGAKLFDKQFIDQYFANHKLKGNESFKWENIKSLVPSGIFAYQGSVTKDNLCTIFGIEGVTEIHSGLNDCLLEWKLYEKMAQLRPIEINGSYYEYNPEYVVPISVLYDNKKIFQYSDIPYRRFIGMAEPIFTHSVTGDDVKEIRKYTTNITGISLENIIYATLNVQNEDNKEFLVNNRKKLKHLGSLFSQYEEIPVSFDENGLAVAQNKEDEAFIRKVNKTTLLVKDKIQPVIDFIRDTIFESKPIKGQEMVISENGKVLALCDLSNEKSVLEIKTYDMNTDGFGRMESDYHKAQLFYQKKNRNLYYLTISFKYEHIRGCVEKLVGLESIIYKVDVNECSLEEYIEDIRKLNKTQQEIYDYAKEHPGCNSIEIAKAFDLHEERVKSILSVLVKKGYVKRPRRYLTDPWTLIK